MFNHQKVGAVIVGAGRGERMGGIDKMFAPIAGKTVLSRVVSAFESCQSVDQIVIVLNEHNLERGKRLLAEEKWAKVKDIRPGGERRQDSVKAGLSRLGDCGWVVIHDGARPLVTVDLIQAGLEAAQETGSAIAAVPVADTIKLADADGFVQETLPRDRLRAVQTPQVFRFDIIDAAYRQCSTEVTDDAALVEAMGQRVRLYTGDYNNIKLTTPADLPVAEVLWRQRRC